jgi:HK97 family phage major capsid protein
MALEELDRYRSVEELLERQREVKARISEINTEHAGLPFPEEAREEFAELKDENEEIDKRVTELKAREEYLVSLQDSPRHTERASGGISRAVRDNPRDIFDLSTIRMDFGNPEVARQEYRDRAMRAVETARFPETVSREKAQDAVAFLIDNIDTEDAQIARRILITGSPIYRRAFSKYLAGKPYTHEEQRALSLTGGSGGFAVPFTLDPSIINVSNGVVNPFRQISRVVQITGDEWRGVASAGVTASYAAEATETTDNAPTLTQPTVSTEKAQAFIPFSIEISMDWSGLQTEMSELLQDAKDTLEAAKFATGTGTNEPFGVVTGTTTTRLVLRFLRAIVRVLRTSPTTQSMRGFVSSTPRVPRRRCGRRACRPTCRGACWARMPTKPRKSPGPSPTPSSS